jgi:signal transduction histidine kinase
MSGEGCSYSRDAIQADAMAYVPLPKARNVRRNLLNEALGTRLDRIRVEAMADFVIVIEAVPSQPGSGVVLASSAADWICPFLPNEPLHYDTQLPKVPTTISNLYLWSAMRPCQLSCGFSVVVPWGSRTTYGWMIITNTSKPDSPRLTRRIAKEYRQQLRKIYVEAGLRTTNKLRLDIARATQAIAEFDVGNHELDELVTNVLSVSRGLLKTAACYLSMPEVDASYFRFVGHQGVRTADFKRLRVGSGQGLGGRVRDRYRTVRTLNYSKDFHGNGDPLYETVREGFHSAMCAPLLSDGRIFGLLYAANRHFTPFTESDAEVLTELAANVSTMLRRAQWDEISRSVERRHERDRLARNLHNTVVHDLMEIGYASRLGRDLEVPLAAKNQFDAIESAAESCLRAIRGEIAGLNNDWEEGRTPNIADVVRLLKSTSSAGKLTCIFRSSPAAEKKSLPAGLATALVRIGREALRNAELHSTGSWANVGVDIEHSTVHLTIEDNGQGIDESILPALISSSEHLGLRQMRYLAEENGGRCIFNTTSAGGLRIEVTVPIDQINTEKMLWTK